LGRSVSWHDDRVLFRRLVETTPQLAWITDPDGYCVYLSPAWISFTGVPLEKCLGYGWLDCVHSGDVVRTRQAFFKANDTQSAYGVEYRLCRRDGTASLVWAVGLPKFDDGGNFYGFLGVTHLLEEYQERADYFGEAVTQPHPAVLSGREKEIVKMISEGNTTDTIAAMLGISTRTVDAHVSNAATKLGASNRVHTVAKAMKLKEI